MKLDSEIQLAYMDYAAFRRAILDEPIIAALYWFSTDQISPANDWDEWLKFWKQIGFNYLIIMRFKGKRNKRKDQFRRDLAIYRLNMMNLPLQLLSDITGFTKWRIRKIVGNVFGALCSTDDQCAFHSYFNRELVRR